MPTSAVISIENLDREHRDVFSNAVHQVLATGIALETYAQIIDGVPLCDVAWDRYEHRLHQQHPIKSHVELCPGALETAKSMRDEMDIRSLSFDSKVLSSSSIWREIFTNFQSCAVVAILPILSASLARLSASTARIGRSNPAWYCHPLTQRRHMPS